MDHQQPPRTPKMAISSLISGILGLLCLLPVIGSLLAIVLGHMSHSSIKNSNGQLGGSGVAIAGFVTGYAGVVLLIPAMLIMAGMMLPALDQARGKAQGMNCANNLKQIGLASIMYAGDDVDEGKFPPSLQTLNDKKYLVDGMVYGCPSAPVPAMTAAGSDYTYLGSGLTDFDDTPTQTVVAYCDNHDNWINVMYVDGHVKGFKGHTIEDTGAVVKTIK
jgi:prepilin-type processing-associated H-X9-DG protein